MQGFTEVSSRIRAMTQEQERSNALLDYANKQLEQLVEVGAETNHQLGGVNQRLAMVSLQQEVSNVLLGNIAELLRLPDSQKQRQHHIELGLKFFKNASKDADLYHDALAEFLSAEKLMTADYFVLRQIGLLYLYATPLIELEKAADYLARAGKYSSVESELNSVRLEYILAKNISKRFSEQRDVSNTDLALFAVESYQHAAVAQYALGRFRDAVKLIDKAAAIDPGNQHLRFFRSKYLAAAGSGDDALAGLRQLNVDDTLVGLVFGDLDLARETAARWDWKSQLADQEAHRKQLELAENEKKEQRLRLLAEKRLSLYSNGMRRVGFAEAQINRLLVQGGTVAIWGDNSDGRCNVPAGLSGIVATAIGRHFVMALKIDGNILIWGQADYTIPPEATGVVGIAAGDNTAMALRNDGTVVAWDIAWSPEKPKLIDVTKSDWLGVVSQTKDWLGVVSLTSNGDDEFYAIKDDGTVVGWNRYKGSIRMPIGVKEIISVSAGLYHTLALKKDRTVVAWGDRGDSALDVPENLTKVAGISAGVWASFAIGNDGNVVSWGKGLHRAPENLRGVMTVSSSNNLADTSIAILENGTVLAWGGIHLTNEPKHGDVVFDPAKIKGAVECKIASGVYAIVMIDQYSWTSNRFVTQEELDAENIAKLKQEEQEEQKQKKALKEMIDYLLAQGDVASQAEAQKKFWQSKDYSAARSFYNKAAKLGSNEAKKRLKKLP